MSEYLSQADIVSWLAYHDLDPDLVQRVELDFETCGMGAMRVVLYDVEPGTKTRRLTPDKTDVLTEERIVPLKSMPGQETISFETSV